MVLLWRVGGAWVSAVTAAARVVKEPENERQTKTINPKHTPQIGEDGSGVAQLHQADALRVGARELGDEGEVGHLFI